MSVRVRVDRSNLSIQQDGARMVSAAAVLHELTEILSMTPGTGWRVADECALQDQGVNYKQKMGVWMKPSRSTGSLSAHAAEV